VVDLDKHPEILLPPKKNLTLPAAEDVTVIVI
jgi:hypothetical protein